MRGFCVSSVSAARRPGWNWLGLLVVVLLLCCVRFASGQEASPQKIADIRLRMAIAIGFRIVPMDCNRILKLSILS
jgi:hypothetical protein